MKGVCFLLLCLIPFNAVIAAIGSGHVAAAAVAATQVAARSQYVAAASNRPPSKAPATTKEPETGYYEFVGGIGLAELDIGKSFLGVSSTETDWVAQNNNNLQSACGNIGIGYVVYLSNSQRYFDTFSWFPSIEPVLNLYFADLTAKGNVYLFNDFTLPTSTFSMPIRTTNLMIDVLLNVIAYRHFALYILGGIGEAWTRVGYHDAPNASGTPTRAALVLNSRTQSHKVYEWGTGVSYAVNCNLKVVLSYLYTHVGNFKTSEVGTLGGVETVLVSPAVFSLRTQAVLLQFQYALS